MKRILTTAIFSMILTGPTLAQAAEPTSIGGGDSIKVHSAKGVRTVQDTTAHTVLDNGSTVSTSTDNNDGETPNGGAGNGGTTSGGDEK